MNKQVMKQFFCYHSFSDWFIESDAQYETYDRWETRMCTKCGKKETRYGEELQLDYDDVSGLDDLGIIPCDFELHQSYTKKGSTKKLICSICGSTKFEVGQDDYFTSVKCCKCGKETGVHSG